ncbi:hypothetical protein HYX07_04810 [Candidatus Woesearchaeota archaeon]|nr:hypothetical protein [Candidatus Woesearchaeota archaeon]
MSTIKIMLLLKRKFSEYYDIRQYKKKHADQIIVKKYSAGNREIIIDEEK